MNGTIEQRQPGVYRLRVYLGRDAAGKPRFVNRTYRGPLPKHNSGRPGAEKALRKLLDEVERGRHQDGDGTFGALLDQFIEHSKAIGRAETTTWKYQWLADCIVKPNLGTTTLSKLTARDLDKLYASLTAGTAARVDAKGKPTTGKPLKATTVRRIHALIAAALHQAKKWQMVERNVASDASPPPVHAARVVAPSPDDVRSVIRAAESTSPMLAVLVFLAALTGARRGELCGLRWSDIDWQDRTLTIARSVYDTPGGGWAEKSTKTHAERTISIDDVAYALLRRHRASVDTLAKDLGVPAPKDGFVFSDSPSGIDPVRPDRLSKFVKRVADKAGVDIHLHSLRHYSVTELIGGGVDVRTVASRHGHADPAVTLRTYSHVLKQRDREAATMIGKTLAPAETAELTA